MNRARLRLALRAAYLAPLREAGRLDGPTVTDPRYFRPTTPATAPKSASDATSIAPIDVDTEDTTCPRCAESHDLAKVKGCIKCLKCGFKFDCNGW